MTISFTLDGQSLVAAVGESILQVATRYGVDIPQLCYKEGYRPDGNCRACVVEIEGERVLAPSCCRAPKEGMVAQAQSARAKAAQSMVIELLVVDSAIDTHTSDSELATWAEKLNVTGGRFANGGEGNPATSLARNQPEPDLSHPAISVNLDACIQCGRCVRACREEQGNDVIGYAWRGDKAKIVFDFDDPMGASSCVGCGECVQACPTGALESLSLLTAKKQQKN
jgi:formate dehydrogenase major subunit